MKLPEEFARKMQRLLKEEYEDYLACYEEPRYYGLRVNTGKISVEGFQKICPFSIEPSPGSLTGSIMMEKRKRRRGILIILRDFITCRSRAP